MNPTLQKICGAALLGLTLPAIYLMMCTPVVGSWPGFWVMNQAIAVQSQLLLGVGGLLALAGGLVGYFIGGVIAMLCAYGGLACLGVKTPLFDKTAIRSA